MLSTISISRRGVIRQSRSRFGEVLLGAGLLGRLGSLVGSVAASVHVDVVGGVDEPVKDGLGDDGVGEQGIPVDAQPSVWGRTIPSSRSFSVESSVWYRPVLPGVAKFLGWNLG